ncbi:MAG: NADH-quinone oxidoreductase subunit A [Fuerstiella sp.]|nr:NADH-quinone oxidoreductase subunit A [Fuerstiella sp.]MCP4856642.1 NADH-quinone oxidoreductase subunit A [Fuerstiella sp.]
MTNLVGHLLLFGGSVCVLLALPMIIGRLVRPKLPTPEKDAIYECGEPAIGSSYIQFDLRFYVVALLFIVFDVEVAFFFPWAAIYGSATQLADTRLDDGAREVLSARLLDQNPAISETISATDAQLLAVTGFFDLLVFFVVLLVGFAYVWKRGDLDWIRALTQKSKQAADQTVPSHNSTSSVTTTA